MCLTRQRHEIENEARRGTEQRPEQERQSQPVSCGTFEECQCAEGQRQLGIASHVQAGRAFNPFYKGGEDPYAASLEREAHGLMNRYCPGGSGQQPPPDPCCKHCTRGQACGDSCISPTDACYEAPGCACSY